MIVVFAAGLLIGISFQRDKQSFGGTFDFNRIESGVTNTNVSVLATSTTVLAANSARVYAALFNDSSNVVYCYLGSGAAVNKGVRLAASGGSYEITPNNLYIGIIDCIASATSTVTVVEK